MNSSYDAGYESAFAWSMVDQCGGPVSGLDANESFGSWNDDYYQVYGVHNTWDLPAIKPNGAYFSGNLFEDTIGASDGAGNTPPLCPRSHPWEAFWSRTISLGPSMPFLRP
jgi:hypothetical protein